MHLGRGSKLCQEASTLLLGVAHSPVLVPQFGALSRAPCRKDASSGPWERSMVYLISGTGGGK